MMLKESSLLLTVLLSLAACHQNQKNTSMNHNPLLQKSDLPLEAPRFDKIKSTDFEPALESAMATHLKEIDSIAGNPQVPTFENTVVALEKSGRDLERVELIFGILTSANTDSILQKTEEKTSPELAAHYDAIFLNDKLFRRVKSVYEKTDQLNLDSESKRLIQYYYDQFIRSGANLNEEDKEKLKELNKKAASLSSRFVNKLLAATKEGALVIKDSNLLEGLPENELKAAHENAVGRGLKDSWILTLQNTTQQPALQNLENRETRKRLFEHSWNRTEKGDSNDTRAIIRELALIRAQKAALLGFQNYAGWKLQDQMAKNPETVMHFLDQLILPSVNKGKEEAQALQDLIKKEGSRDTLEPYDWNFFAEKIRKQKYDLNEEEIKPYFELNNVLEKGVFYAAQKLYGLTFKERKDLPVWNPDVRTFDVFDDQDSLLGIFYCDYFKRDNKGGGAWMSNLVNQSRLLHEKPVIYNVANFSQPAKGQPALLSFDDVTTMFHEFGHALHGFFADQEYPSLSGTNVPRDFVEFPSQFNEHWALEDDILKNYAIHYQTGASMPDALIQKIKNSTHFNQGYDFTELLAAALLDMKWHTISESSSVGDVDTFEREALKSSHIYLTQIPPRYRSSYFLHIWGNDYAAGYYAYIWTQMLDEDTYAWFQQNGGMTRENGDRFRKLILSQGNTKDFSAIFHQLIGRDPQIEPLLKAKGLK